MTPLTPPEALLERREFPVDHWRVTPVSSAAHSEVILVHGLGEHSGRMMPLARQLASLGYNCRVPDLPGHGGCGGQFHHAVIEAYLHSADATEVIDRLEDILAHLTSDVHRLIDRVAEVVARIDDHPAGICLAPESHDHLVESFATGGEVLAHQLELFAHPSGTDGEGDSVAGDDRCGRYLLGNLQ